MKKIIAGAIAGIFLMSGAAMAIDPLTSKGSWQGSQNQSYDSYNFQGLTHSDTTTITKGLDTSATKYNQQNCNYDTHTFSTNVTGTYSIANVVTDGKLQNQGLSMGQIGDQNSEATPAWGVAGGVAGAGFGVVGGAAGYVHNQAGASGVQGQDIGAVNAQANGNFSLAAATNVNQNFTFNKADVNTFGGAASGNYANSAWGVGGIVSGAAGQVGFMSPSWGVSGLIAGFAGADAGAFNIASAGYNTGALSVNGTFNEHKDLTVNASLDFQYQNGAGTAYQDSVTCAGINCHQPTID